MQHVPIEEIPSHCRFVNTEIFEEARARGRGVVLLSAHFGAWEIGGLAIMALIPNVSTVARPLDNELLERDLAQLRARTGAEVVDRKRAARLLLRAPSRYGALILLPDQAVQPPER